MKSIWEDLKSRLTSRKFWVAIIGGVSLVLINTFGMDPDSATRISYGIVIIVVAYITDESLVDIFRSKYGKDNEG